MADRALTNEEVIKLSGGKCNYLNYKDLTQYDNIFDAMGKHKALVLLYLSKNNYGHFTCVFCRDKNIIEMFDSFGFDMPDDEFEYIPYEERLKNNELFPYLTKLLYESGKQIEVNEDQLQDFKAKTCGRHVACRLRLRNMKIEDYVKLMNSTDLTPDELVIYLTDVI